MNINKKKTLVLGASLNHARYSNRAIRELRNNGVSTVAIGLKKGNIKDIEIETEPKIYKDIHTLSLYLNPKRQKEYYQYVIALNPKRVIFNPGTENDELMYLLNQNRIHYEIACTLVLLTTGQF